MADISILTELNIKYLSRGFGVLGFWGCGWPGLSLARVGGSAVPPPPGFALRGPCVVPLCAGGYSWAN